MDSGSVLTRSDKFNAIWERVRPRTTASWERGRALWTAVSTVVESEIPGAMVQCGTGTGGAAMLIAATLIQRQAATREVFLFDRFDGPAEPSPADAGRAAAATGGSTQDVRQEVEAAVRGAGYDFRLVHLIEGDLGDTLPRTSTLRIALLDLDTQSYENTTAALRNLYPRVAQGGILMLGSSPERSDARRAVDEYFADPDVPFSRPMLWAIDEAGLGGVKTESGGEVEIPRYDYIPPGMTPPDLLPLFPHAKPGNVWAVDWPYLRKEVPHIWRSDDRHKGYVTGNASVEEAACLYSFAQQFAGKRGLEIGTHYGWTAAHLLAAGLQLDCIDPALSDAVRKRDISEVLDAVPGSKGYRLWAGFSPQIVPEVRESAREPWSFAFIDGNHDGDAPANDAREVLKYLAPDAMVVFHDLTSPFVEKGLAVFRAAGFKTRLINTMQILGVAWRGNVKPPEHVDDPNVLHIYSAHLAKYL